MDFKYPKTEKLKSKRTIDTLFSHGKSVGVFPLRIVYVQLAESAENVPFQIGVSVSKKYFKKATDRNYLKRVLRETYRLNKNLLQPNLDRHYAMMFFYQTKEILPFDEINTRTVRLFEKFLKQIATEKHT